mmetsp:Transcript_51351/g.135344  ORF Transcript_51351/g.135344 Transcript_51351/m.135344 type:complete len:207 (-) Transcript_51351:1804-2424(-)
MTARWKAGPCMIEQRVWVLWYSFATALGEAPSAQPDRPDRLPEAADRLLECGTRIPYPPNKRVRKPPSHPQQEGALLSPDTAPAPALQPFLCHLQMASLVLAPGPAQKSDTAFPQPFLLLVVSPAGVDCRCACRANSHRGASQKQPSASSQRRMQPQSSPPIEGHPLLSCRRSPASRGKQAEQSPPMPREHPTMAGVSIKHSATRS